MPERAVKKMRVPPNNYDAEQSILGSMLLSAKCVDEALVYLRSEFFTIPSTGIYSTPWSR
jgi:replicative DNA helicase